LNKQNSPLKEFEYYKFDNESEEEFYNLKVSPFSNHFIAIGAG